MNSLDKCHQVQDCRVGAPEYPSLDLCQAFTDYTLPVPAVPRRLHQGMHAEKLYEVAVGVETHLYSFEWTRIL